MLKRAFAVLAMLAIVVCFAAVDVAYVAEAFLTSGPPDEVLARILGRPVRPEQLLQEALGPEAHLERVEVVGIREIHGFSDLLKLKTIEVHGLRVASRIPRRDPPDFLSVRQISLRLDRFALFERRIEPIEIVLDGLRVDLVPGADGEIELVQLINALSAKTAGGPAIPPPAVAVKDGTVRFELKNVFAPGYVQQITDLDLHFRPLSPVLLSVEGSFNLGVLGRWTLRGDLQTETKTARIHLATQGLHLGPETAAILSKQVVDNFNNYSPNGLADLEVDLTLAQEEEKDAAGKVTTKIKPTFIARLTMRGLEMTYKNFAYPVIVTSGMAELRNDGFRLIRLSGKSTTASTRIIIDGEADGYERADGLHLRISLDDVEIDKKLRAALQPDDQEAFDLFAPSGRARAYCDVDKKPGAGERAINHMRLTCEDVQLTFRSFPYTLSHVTGDVEFLENEILAKNMVGFHGPTEFRIYGKINDLGQGAGFDVTIDTTHVVLNDELRKAFDPEMQEVWDLFTPSGTADVRWRTERRSGANEKVHNHIHARCLDVNASYVETPYPVKHVLGEIDYEPGMVKVRHLTGDDGPAQVELNGSVRLSEPTPLVRLEVRGKEVPINEKLLRAMPQGLRELVQEVAATGMVDFLLNVERGPAPGTPGSIGNAVSIDAAKHPTIMNFDGNVKLVDCGFSMGAAFTDVYGNLLLQGVLGPSGNEAKGAIAFAQARAEGKRMTDVKTPFSFKTGQLFLPDLTATLYSGLVTGEMKIGTADKKFDADIHVNGLDLAAFVRDSYSAGRDVTGHMNGQIHLAGRGLDKKAMTGNGSIRIEDGQLWDVPVFLTLLNGLSLSQRKTFQTGTVDFTLADSVAHISKLDFEGDDLAVKGKGTLDLNGNIDLTLDVGVPVALIPNIPILFDIWKVLRKAFYAVGMTGTFKEPQLSLKPLPILGSGEGITTRDKVEDGKKYAPEKKAEVPPGRREGR